MKIKQFIEKAIEGGWEQPLNKSVEDYTKSDIAKTFLDPKAWEAVGKVEGWKKEVCFWCGSKESRGGMTVSTPDSPPEGWQTCEGCGIDWMEKAEFGIDGNHIPEWKYIMHQMIDALCEGKTIEEFIKTL